MLALCSVALCQWHFDHMSVKEIMIFLIFIYFGAIVCNCVINVSNNVRATVYTITKPLWSKTIVQVHISQYNPVNTFFTSSNTCSGGGTPEIFLTISLFS